MSWNAKSAKFCCNATSQLLPCKQACCFWYLVYINCPLSRSGAAPPLQKGDIHVQDCIHRPPSLQLAVRPPDGLDRPPADREQPHRHSQRRPSPFRALSPENKGLPRPRRDRTNDKPFDNSHQWPRLPGAIFCAQPKIGVNNQLCDKSAGVTIGGIIRLLPGISHTKMPSTAFDQNKSASGGGPCSPRGQSGRWGDRRERSRAPLP